MLNRLLEKIWLKFKKSPSVFNLKFLFILICAGLVTGLLFTLLLLLSEKIVLVKNSLLIIFLTILVIIYALVINIWGLHKLLKKGMFNALSHIRFPEFVNDRYLLQFPRRLELVNYEDKILRLIDERILTEVNYRKNYQIVSSKYGFFVPEEQLNKILEDENFFTLHGKIKNIPAVAVCLKNAIKVIDSRDKKDSYEFFSKVLKKTIQLAKKYKLFFAEFHGEIGILYGDLPYNTGDDIGKSILNFSGDWIKEIKKINSKFNLPIKISSIIHYGSVSAGRLNVEYSNLYHVGGFLREEIIKFYETRSSNGLFISDKFTLQYSINVKKTGLSKIKPGLYKKS